MAFAQEDWVGSLKVTSMTNGCININTNTGTSGFDISGYEGKLAVMISCGAGVSGTVIVPSLKAGTDTNISNANNWVLNITNFTNTVSNAVVNVDLRSSAFGTTTTVINKYLYLSWLITGSATANSAIDAFLVGQQKYST